MTLRNSKGQDHSSSMQPRGAFGHSMEKNGDQSFGSARRKDSSESGELQSFSSTKKAVEKIEQPVLPDAPPNLTKEIISNGNHSLVPPGQKESSESAALQTFSSKKKTDKNERLIPAAGKGENPALPNKAVLSKISETPVAEKPEENLSFAKQQKLAKKAKIIVKDEKLLNSDNWLVRNGHTVTYVGLYLFSFFVFFRPYEWLPQLTFLQIGAFILAISTLLVFFPTQFVIEGSPTIFTTEVKCVLFLAGWSLLTMPIAKDRGLAWDTFNDPFIKAVLMFVVMVNVLRNRRRLLGIMWISFGISIVLSYMAIGMYMRGELKSEGYRVEVNFGGMMGNPNDLALHLVTMTPLAICLGIAAKNNLMRIVYFTMAGLFVAANMFTYSRGGFLGLIVACGVMAWKLGRNQRGKTILASLVVGILFILLAPGNYGLRLLSIFIPGLDTAGSSNQRQESLILSIIVTLRNPWGIGLGCFPVVGIQNLQTHNAYTQVSSELGLPGFAAYLIFIISPLRKLAAIERHLIGDNKNGWYYYLAIGLQASLAGFMVSSFFDAIAYNWFIYYLIAYAVAFRRIYQTREGAADANKASFELAY